MRGRSAFRAEIAAATEALAASAELRRRIVGAVRDPGRLVTPPIGWPPCTAVRRMAWHVPDHLWEIEDESDRT
ncbi:MAG TPA: hypothetical protein VLM11_02835 [Streptosporangiaceae bacterium]|nr:hypothetical protein [Streptosporangiaceae bacterium]